MRQLRLHAALAVAAMLALGAGCTETLPPPAAPTQELSADLTRRALSARPPEGQGVVVLDAVDGPATVEDLGTELDGAGAEEICAETPCVARLALGDHRLVFHRDGRDDEVDLTVSAQPSAYRRAMSYDSGEHAEYFGLAVSGFTIGGLMLPIIDPMLDIGMNNSTAADIALVTGGVVAGAAIVVGVVGVILAITDPRQTREGAGRQWTLSRP